MAEPMIKVLEAFKKLPKEKQAEINKRFREALIRDLNYGKA